MKNQRGRRALRSRSGRRVTNPTAEAIREAKKEERQKANTDLRKDDTLKKGFNSTRGEAASTLFNLAGGKERGQVDIVQTHGKGVCRTKTEGSKLLCSKKGGKGRGNIT